MLPERIVFMGTPEFACPCLEALVEAGAAPVLVVTQPDRPSGRGRRLKPPPVKEISEKHGIPVFQPAKVKHPEAQEKLRNLRPDVIVVAAFGQILPQSLLDIPRLGCVNVHASLLPRHRGASPVAAAIREGDGETGVTIMRMEAGLDTGPAYLEERVPIPDGVTTGGLEETLSEVGASLLVRALPGIADGSLEPVAQDDSMATYAPRLKREDGLLDFSLSSVSLERQVRALNPWPGGWFEYGDEIIKVWEAAVGPPSPGNVPSGTTLDRPPLSVVCGDGGSIILKTIQRRGKRALPSEEVMRGFKIPPGTRFGTIRETAGSEER